LGAESVAGAVSAAATVAADADSAVTGIACRLNRPITPATRSIGKVIFFIVNNF
jgi:hypothetical protein